MKRKILNYIVTLLFICSLIFTVPVNAEGKTFRDVSNSDWFAPYVYTLLEEGTVTGMTGTTFAPGQSLTRAQLITMLIYREPEDELEKCRNDTSFTDVSSKQWFAPYVNWAADQGFVSGYTDGTFQPNQPVSRAEAATMIARFAEISDDIELPEVNEEILFTDKSSIPLWARQAVSGCQKAGIFDGYPDGSFRPSKTMTRAEACAALCSLFVVETPDENNDSGLELYFIDVGQGDAIFVRCEDHAMLIDGGTPSNSQKIYSFLVRKRIKHLDYIIATHGHYDHVGGLSAALNCVTAGRALAPKTDYESETFLDLTRYLKKQDLVLEVPSPGDVFSLGEASFEVLGPIRESSNDNNMSLVLRLTYGSFHSLFAGDAETSEEQDILELGKDLKSDVLKVGHHGSSTSSGYWWLYEIQPEIAVISCGKNNSYGHPEEEPLSRMRDADITVLRTDLQGDVRILAAMDGSYSYTVQKNPNADTLVPAEK